MEDGGGRVEGVGWRMLGEVEDGKGMMGEVKDGGEGDKGGGGGEG